MKNSINREAGRVLMITTALGFALALPGTALAQQSGTSPTTGPQVGPEAAPTAVIPSQSPSAETTTFGIEEIVVTARRSSESQQSVPIAITTVTAQDLKDLSVRDLIEVQKVTPGLYISSQNSGGRAKLMIRGQTEADSRLTTDGSVGVYIDGVNFIRDYGLRSSLVDIAQIEVLKGPQGTLFGKNTTGGALNITTNHPTYDLGGYVDLLYGSYNNRQVLAVANVPIANDTVALRLVAQSIDRNGYGHAGNGEDVGDDHVQTGRALLRVDPSPTVHLLLSADYVRQRNHGTNVVITNDSMLQNANTANGALGAIAAQLGLNPASAADRLTAYNQWLPYFNAYQSGTFYSGFGSAPHFFDNLDQYGYSATVELDLGAVIAKSITSYRHVSKDYLQDLDATPFALFFAEAITHQNNFSQEFQLSSIHGVGLDWQAGLFYNRETGEEYSSNNTNDYVNAGRANINDGAVKNSSVAAYAQGVYHFSETLRATGGIRYTKDDRALDSKNRVDPAFAIPPILPGAAARCNLLAPAQGGPVFPNCSYQVSQAYEKPTWLVSVDGRPIPEVMTYGSVSTGYRAGGFTFQGSSAVQPTQAALNAVYTPFLPETVTNYEAGFKSDLLDQRLRVNGAGYYQDYKNIQQQIRDSVNGLLVNLIRNAAKATIYGSELEVTARPTRELTLTTGISYLHARFKQYFALDAKGNLLDLSALPFSAPEWTYNLGAAYIIPLSNGSIRLNANYAHTGAVNFQPTAPTASSVTQPAYGLLDARVTWNIRSDQLDVALFGKNLTNKRYLNAATNAQAIGWNIGFPGDPRTFGIEARKTF